MSAAIFHRSVQRSRCGSIASILAATEALRIILYSPTPPQTTDEGFERNVLFVVMQQKRVKVGRIVRKRLPQCQVDDLRDRRAGLSGSQSQRLVDIVRKVDRRPLVYVHFFCDVMTL
jgi:hypothetical protein